MFSGTGLFKAVACPEADTCFLPNCIFSHQTSQVLDTKPKYWEETADLPNGTPVSTVRPLEFDHSIRKRRKIDSDDAAATLSARIIASPSLKPEAKAYVGTLHPMSTSRKSAPTQAQRDQLSTDQSLGAHGLNMIDDARVRGTLAPALSERKKPISSVKTLKEEARSGTKASLNPRLIPKDPAGHARRVLYLTKLHGEMVRLNKEASQSTSADTKAEYLSDNELVIYALDEEEKLARENPSIYANVMGLRIVAYKRMKLKEWVETLKKRKKSKKEQQLAVKDQCIIDTGLSPDEEILILSRMLPEKATLEKHGYLTTEPAVKDIENAKEAAKSAAGWEICDRCQTRFQVFPDRREDGALTSGGACAYHWGRTVRPDKKRTDAITGEKSPFFSCCHEALGTAGCSKASTHVFKVTNGTRLASIMPFAKTPGNADIPKDTAVCFDCEMAYTVHGLELVRLSAVRWPQGTPLLDFLVRPKGAVLDLNSRFSGVFPEEFTNAAPLMPGKPLHPYKKLEKCQTDGGKMSPLHIVSSPEEARSLLFSQISPTTPLLGHALENDLNAMRIIHPAVVDTAILFPHPRGLPFRFGLQRLAKTHLQRDIQTAGSSGHDSLEDAQATGDLVRWKVERKWKSLKKDGWRIDGDGLLEPSKA